MDEPNRTHRLGNDDNQNTFDYQAHNRSVTWNFFKGPVNKNDSINIGQLNTTIRFSITKCDVWTGKATFYAYAVVFVNDSWINPDFKNQEVLNHFQIKYNLSQLYAKKFEYYVNSWYINGGAYKKINKILTKYIEELAEEQKRFDLESQYGNNLINDNKWSENIKNELMELTK